MLKTIQGHEVTNDPQNVLDWLEANHPTVYNLLLLTDEFYSGVIFGDQTTHTISWHIATMAKNGDPIAKLACNALNELQENHCAIVLAGGA